MLANHCTILLVCHCEKSFSLIIWTPEARVGLFPPLELEDNDQLEPNFVVNSVDCRMIVIDILDWMVNQRCCLKCLFGLGVFLFHWWLKNCWVVCCKKMLWLKWLNFSQLKPNQTGPYICMCFCKDARGPLELPLSNYDCGIQSRHLDTNVHYFYT